MPNEPEGTAVDSPVVMMDHESMTEQDLPSSDRRYCFKKLTRRGCFILAIVLLLLSTGLAVVITYFVAKAIVANAKVQPTDITMHASGGGVDTRSSNSSEVIKMDLSAAITNEAILGGVLKSTPIDVYATLNGAEKKVVSLVIPDTTVSGSVSAKQVTICDTKTNDNNVVCSLSELTDSDLSTLNELVQVVLSQENIEMRMEAPDGVRLSAFGIIPLPFAFDFNKKFTAAGMNGALDKVTIESFDLKDSDESELKFKANATVSNPSIFGFTLLPSKMEIYTPNDKQASCDAEIYMGIASTVGSVLLKASSSVQMTMEGVLPPADSPRFDLDCMDNFIQRYFSGSSNSVIAKVMPNSSSSIYLNSMLKNTVLKAFLPNGYDGQLFESTTLNSLDFKPKSDDSFSLSNDLSVLLNSPVGSSKMITKSMDSLSVEMLYEDTVVGILTGSGVLNDAHDPSDPLSLRMNVDGTLQVTPVNEKGFASFVKALMMTSGELPVTLAGYASATVETLLGDNLTLNRLNLQTTLLIKGMNGLSENQITKFDLSSSTATEIKMDVEMNVQNPTDNTMSTGPLSFDVTVDGTTVATLSTTSDVTLKKQSVNTLKMTGSMTELGIKTPGDRENLGKLLSQYLSNKKSVVSAQASAVATSHPLLNAGLQGVSIKTVMDPLPEQLIENLEFNSMGLHNPDESSVGLSSSAVIQTFKALGENGVFKVQDVTMDVALKTAADGEVLGRLSLPPTAPSSNVSPVITVDLEGRIALAHSGAKMTGWMKSFMESEEIPLFVDGTTNVNAVLPGFKNAVPMTNIPVSNSVLLAGMNKTGSVFPVEVASFDLPSNTKEGVKLEINGAFDNPSIASLSVGTLYGVVHYNDAAIGNIEIPDFKILPGKNVFDATGQVASTSQAGFDAIQKFFNQYVQYRDSSCVIKASVVGAPWLSKVLQDTKMTSVIPGMNSSVQLIQSLAFDESTDMNIKMLRDSPSSFSGALAASMSIPFDFPVSVASYGNSVVSLSSDNGLDNVGKLKLESQKCVGQCSTSGPIILPMKATLDPSGSESNFKTFIRRVVGGNATETVPMFVTGALSCKISTNLNFNGQMLSVAAPVDTSKLASGTLGMPSFGTLGPIEIQNLEIANGLKDKLPMETKAKMCNPTSFVNMEVDNLQLGVFFNDMIVAAISQEGADETILLPKSECIVLSMKGSIDKKLDGYDDVNTNRLFGNYISNIDSDVTVKALPDPSYLVQDALAELPLPTVLPANQCDQDDPTAGCKLVVDVIATDVEFNTNPIKVVLNGGRLLKSNYVTMFVQNPFMGTVLSPTSFGVTINFRDKYLGYIDEGPVVHIEGGDTKGIALKVKGVDQQGMGAKRQAQMACDLFKGTLKVDTARGTILGAKIGEFDINVPYEQYHVPITCQMDNFIQSICDKVMADDDLIGKFVKAGCNLTGVRKRYLTEMKNRR